MAFILTNLFFLSLHVSFCYILVISPLFLQFLVTSHHVHFFFYRYVYLCLLWCVICCPSLYESVANNIMAWPVQSKVQ